MDQVFRRSILYWDELKFHFLSIFGFAQWHPTLASTFLSPSGLVLLNLSLRVPHAGPVGHLRVFLPFCLLGLHLHILLFILLGPASLALLVTEHLHSQHAQVVEALIARDKGTDGCLSPPTAKLNGTLGLQGVAVQTRGQVSQITTLTISLFR